MTKREAMRQTHQANTLTALGFTPEEAESLRRISMTLHRWHELECGDSNDFASWTVTRGRKGEKQADGRREFIHDENGTPFMERHVHTESKPRYSAIPDREKGALKRLAKIMNARLYRQPKHDAENDLTPYIQTDPRGAALYILRPGDVPAGGSADAYYSRGICVY